MGFLRLVLMVVTAASLAGAGCTFDDRGLPFASDAGADAAAPIDAEPPPPPDAMVKASAPVLTGLGPATLAEDADARAWAVRASAAQIAFTAYLPVSQADALHRAGDPCPIFASDGEKISYTGGCVTMAGDAWSGSARINGPLVDGVPPAVSYDHFGHDGTALCMNAAVDTEVLYTGTVVRTGATPAGHAIAVDLLLEETRATAACTGETTDVGIDYQLGLLNGPDVDHNSTPDFRVFDGSGRVGKATGENAGLVVASTSGERTAESCGAEALEGSTTLAAGGHTVVITYDGATDCNDKSTVTWTLDGTDRGKLEGVACRVAMAPRGRGGAGGAVAIVLGLAGALTLARRRRRRRSALSPSP